MGRLLNKTLLNKERNKESCGQSRGIVVVEVIVEPVVVPVPPVVVPVEVTDVEVAIGVAVLHKTPPIPPPFEVIFYDLGVESNSVS